MPDEQELQRRLQLLKIKLEEGKMVFAEHLREGVQESFSKVRYGADGNVDLSTVDGRIRSMAMAVVMMQDRDDTKAAASLPEIQHAFFERISPMFEGVHALMVEKGANPQSASWALSRDAEQTEKNYPLIEPFVRELYEFWEVVSEPVQYHLQDLKALKGVFGGDLFPSYDRNIVSSAGLYLDTIIVTDPFMNSRDLFAKWPKGEAVRMFLKHGLQLMNYRGLVLAETDPPIVVVLPFDSATDSNYRESLASVAQAKALSHAGKLFGREFQSADELQDFLTVLAEPSDVAQKISDSTRLLFDTEWAGPPEVQLQRAIEEFSFVMGEHAGGVIFNQSFGRMAQATDITWKSTSLGGVPLIDAPTSWQYYNWSLEYDAERDSKDNIPLHMTRGLQRLAETDMTWLGNIPPDSLIEMRQEGALDEIRELLSNGIDDVVALDPDNFFRSADKIYDNMEAAFGEHNKKIADLRSKKWKFAGQDIGSWLVAGSIEVAAAVFGSPAWGIATAAITQVTDAPKLKDIPGKIRELKQEDRALSKSAAGLLFKHKD